MDPDQLPLDRLLNAYLRWAPSQIALDTEEGQQRWTRFWDYIHTPPGSPRAPSGG